jgi:limonene-1,2-epoxide hydrolase
VGRNSEIALAFFAAMNAVTKEAPNKRAVLSFFTPETVFDNIPMDRIVGAEGIWKLLDLGAEAVDWVVHSIAETEDGVVLTEGTTST